MYKVYELRVEGELLPIYVGKARDNSKRYLTHMRLARKGHEGRLYRKIRKCWRNDKTVTEKIVKANLTEKQAFALEIRMISKYGRKEDGGPLYNHCSGGEGASGTKWTQEHRDKMVKIMKNRTFTPEHRAAISKAKQGTKVSDKTREAQKKAVTGKPLSSEHRALLSLKGKGRKFTDETRKKISESKLGKPRPDIILKRSKPIRAYSKDGQFVGDFSSARKAQEVLNVNYRLISQMLNGKIKSTGGYVFQFL